MCAVRSHFVGERSRHARMHTLAAAAHVGGKGHGPKAEDGYGEGACALRAAVHLQVGRVGLVIQVRGARRVCATLRHNEKRTGSPKSVLIYL